MVATFGYFIEQKDPMILGKRKFTSILQIDPQSQKYFDFATLIGPLQPSIAFIYAIQCQIDFHLS